MPTYNSEKTIGSTLESILNQTYSNFIVKISDN
ncbi:glycosyltransferase family A protein, partial [Hydrogenovibrio marinus]